MAARRRGFVSSAAFPLRDSNYVFGALTLYSSAPNAFDENEVKLLEKLTYALGLGVERLRKEALDQLR